MSQAEPMEQPKGGNPDPNIEAIAAAKKTLNYQAGLDNILEKSLSGVAN